MSSHRQLAPKKRGPGRPSKADLGQETAAERAERVARTSAGVIKRHRRDLKQLRQVISDAQAGNPQPGSQDAQRLASATKTLHELERQAYDLTDQGPKVQAVILIPAPAPDMAKWQQMAQGTFPAREQVTGPPLGERIEPDVIGEPGQEGEP